MPVPRWLSAAAVGAAASLGAGCWYTGIIGALIGRIALFVECKRYRVICARRPKRIIIMRHGESEGNLDLSLFARIPDHAMTLSEAGHLQAQATGRRLRALLGNETLHCYVSPFRRATQTLHEVLQAFDRDQIKIVREDARLREQEWGNFQDPSEFERTKQQRMLVGRFWYRFTTGESGADVFGRADAFMETLFRSLDGGGGQEQKPADNILIVTHGLTARFLVMRYFRWSISTFESVFNLQNAEFWVLKRDPDGRYHFCCVEGHPIRSSMNVTVEFTNGLTRQMTIPDYVTIPAPRKLQREEILRRLELDGDDVARIDFHSAPHVKEASALLQRPSRLEVEVELHDLVRDCSLQVPSPDPRARGSFDRPTTREPRMPRVSTM